MNFDEHFLHLMKTNSMNIYFEYDEFFLNPRTFSNLMNIYEYDKKNVRIIHNLEKYTNFKKCSPISENRSQILENTHEF